TDSPRIVVSPRVRTRPPPVTSSASGPHHSGGGAPHRCYRRPRVWDVLALLPQAAKPSREKASSGPEPALTSWTPDLESVSSPSLRWTACGSCGRKDQARQPTRMNTVSPLLNPHSRCAMTAFTGWTAGTPSRSFGRIADFLRECEIFRLNSAPGAEQERTHLPVSPFGHPSEASGTRFLLTTRE